MENTNKTQNKIISNEV